MVVSRSICHASTPKSACYSAVCRDLDRQAKLSPARLTRFSLFHYARTEGKSFRRLPSTIPALKCPSSLNSCDMPV